MSNAVSHNLSKLYVETNRLAEGKRVNRSAQNLQVKTVGEKMV